MLKMLSKKELYNIKHYFTGIKNDIGQEITARTELPRLLNRISELEYKLEEANAKIINMRQELLNLANQIKGILVQVVNKSYE